MPANKTALSGNTAMLLLKLLSERDMYGYEMIEALAQRSNNIFELKVGTLYPLLHSLVQEGYLTSYSQEVNGKLRKYYQITPNGRKYMDKITKEWRDYIHAVDAVLSGKVVKEGIIIL